VNRNGLLIPPASESLIYFKPSIMSICDIWGQTVPEN